MAKKTFKNEQIIAAYSVLKSAKLGKIDTVSDRIKVADILRTLRPVAKAHDENMEAAAETLKPEGYDEMQKRLRNGENFTQMDALRNGILTNEYNEALNKYARQRLEEEVEVDLVSLGKECTDKLIESNPEWSVEQLMSLMDVLD